MLDRMAGRRRAPRRLCGAEHIDPRRRAAHRRDDLLHRGLPGPAARARRPPAGLQPEPGAGRARRCWCRRSCSRRCARSATACARRSARRSSRSHGAHADHAERMQLGDGRADERRLLRVVRRYSREHHVFDMGAVAREAGTVVSAVMFGAIAASGALPFARAAFERSIRAGGKGAGGQPARLCRALRIVSAGAGTRLRARCRQRVQRWPRHGARRLQSPPLQPAALRDFPAAGARPRSRSAMRACSTTRTRAYAELYLQRLQRVLAAERAADPAGAHGYARSRARPRASWRCGWRSTTSCGSPT